MLFNTGLHGKPWLMLSHESQTRLPFQTVPLKTRPSHLFIYLFIWVGGWGGLHQKDYCNPVQMGGGVSD